MSKRIYVGNLTDDITDSDLTGLFTPFGAVRRARIAIDKETNRPKGFGFVEMDDDSQADAAIRGVDAREYGGRNLKVKEAKPRATRDGDSVRRA